MGFRVGLDKKMRDQLSRGELADLYKDWKIALESYGVWDDIDFEPDSSGTVWFPDVDGIWGTLMSAFTSGYMVALGFKGNGTREYYKRVKADSHESRNEPRLVKFKQLTK